MVSVVCAERRCVVVLCEELGDRSIRRDALDRIGEDLRDGQDFEFRSEQRFLIRQRVRYDDTFDRGFREHANRVASEDAVRGTRVDLGRATFDERFGGFGERAAGRDHVVDDDGDLARDVADDLRDFRDVGLRAALEDDRDIGAKAFGEILSARHAAGIG